MSRSLTKPVTGHGGTESHTYSNPKIKSNTIQHKFVFSDVTGSRSDIVKRPRGGFRLPTPYSCTVNELFPVRVAASFTEDTVVWTPDFGNQKTKHYVSFAGAHGAPVTIDESARPSFGTNAESALIAKALNKVKDQKINLAVAIAESQATVDLLAGSLRKLGLAYRSARRLNWKQAARHLGVDNTVDKNHKSSKDGWLQLQYGWMPLLSDIHGAYSLLTEKARTDGFIVTGKASTTSSGRSAFSRKISFGDGNYWCQAAFITRWHSQLKIRLDYRLDSSKLNLVMALGLTNPALVAWELVPFSFLVDWAVPIGAVLDALDATVGTTFLGGSLTEYHKGVQVGDSSTFGHVSMRGAGSMTAVTNKMVMTRKVYKLSPKPLPFVKNPFSVQHALNAYALLK